MSLCLTGTLKGDKLLKEEQLFSEVLSVILAEPDVEGIGLFFDTDQFHTYSTLRAGSANLTEALRYLLELQYGAITDIQLNEELQKIADGYKFVIETTKELFGPYAYTVCTYNLYYIQCIIYILYNTECNIYYIIYRV